jgi:Iron-sulfur cluster binding domain of dihydroorotate dehydrogenase B
MKTAKGKLEEIYLDGSARIACPPELTPAPGQYLLAHADGSDSPLPVPVFSSLPSPQSGFRSAPGLPASWRPGQSLHLRGPIGHGFTIPATARKIALVAFDDAPARLLGLLSSALKQNAEVVVICNSAAEDLPEIVEIQPLKALPDALQWAEYAAMDVSRENLNQLRERLAGKEQVTAKIEAQVLIRSPMPCGALAECGVCALAIPHDWKMICKDGPVFELRDLL